MTLTVLKPFPHPSRRLAVGDSVSEFEASEGPIPMEDLKRRRFVAGPESKAQGRAGLSAADLKKIAK